MWIFSTTKVFEHLLLQKPPCKVGTEAINRFQRVPSRNLSNSWHKYLKENGPQWPSGIRLEGSISWVKEKIFIHIEIMSWSSPEAKYAFLYLTKLSGSSARACCIESPWELRGFYPSLGERVLAKPHHTFCLSVSSYPLFEHNKHMCNFKINLIPTFNISVLSVPFLIIISAYLLHSKYNPAHHWGQLIWYRLTFSFSP